MKTQNFKQTEIGKIPEDWEIKKLKEISSRITKGTTPTTLKKNFVSKGINFVKVECLDEQGNIDKSKFMFIDEETDDLLNRSKIKDNDILYSIAGTIGRVAIAKKEILPANTNQALAIITLNKEENLEYIKYSLINPLCKNYLLSKSIHAVQANLSLTELGNSPIIYPPLPEQLSIASILSSLDAKIELNNKMNKTLEEIGQAIFKKWFVDNSEREGWEISTIGIELKTILGGTPSRVKPEYWNGNINWINSGKVNEFRIIEPSEKITEEGLNKSATSLLPKGTVVLAITGATLGQVSRLEINSCANQSVIGVLENERFSSPYIYYWITNNIWDIVGHQTGGAQQHINKGNVDNYQLLIPEEQTLKKFNNLIEPIFKQISNNCFQSQTLSQIRDDLLPKLMSGEVRVPVEGVKG